MEITEVRIKLMDDPNDRLRAFCSITFDSAFVIRDLKIIEGTKGAFVAMPSRKLTDRCPRCGCKNHLRGAYCNQCGAALGEYRATQSDDGRSKLYADIAHPINSECREMIQTRVLSAFEDELLRSTQPDYVCTYDDYGEERFATLKEDGPEPAQTTAAQTTAAQTAEAQTAAVVSQATAPEVPAPEVPAPEVPAPEVPAAAVPEPIPAASPSVLPLQPATLVNPDQTSHRIEPAADQQASGPHSAVDDAAPVGQPDLAESACEDDNFGAGIV